MFLRKPLLFALVATLSGSQCLPAAQEERKLERHAMVVTIHHEASEVGLAVLKQGGNAVDAAVAVGFALAVVLPQAGNLGGGGFMLIRMAGGTAGGAGLNQANKPGEPTGTHFLDFRERAPGAATAEMYLDAGKKVVPDLSTFGYKAIGVPGSVAGLAYAQAHFGRLPLREVMAPAIRLAERGYVLTEEEAESFHAGNLVNFPESRRIFQRDGNFLRAGETFKQPELARTLRRLAEDPDSFYHGAMAKELAAAMRMHGGLLTEADLAAYRVIDRKPLVGQFRTGGEEYDVITSPPPSSGGIALLETLNMLAPMDLKTRGADRSAAQVHLIAEAFRRAYMDRADYLGDPDYSAIPLREMASQAYATAWRKTIDPVRSTPSRELKRPPGLLPAPPPVSANGKASAHRKESTETTHYSIVDADGNAVATTYTLNGLFGCGAMADGLGFLLNNEMDDFSSKPGTPNMFGLIQGPANAIAPGHRPLSSMTPTVVTTHAAPGHPARLRLVLGSPGGSTIITTVVNDLLSTLVNGLSVQAAADAPRFHHQYEPDVLDVEKSFSPETVAELRKMGYVVSRANEADEGKAGVWGDSELIGVDPQTGALTAGQDRRHGFGSAAFY